MKKNVNDFKEIKKEIKYLVEFMDEEFLNVFLDDRKLCQTRLDMYMDSLKSACQNKINFHFEERAKNANNNR